MTDEGQRYVLHNGTAQTLVDALAVLRVHESQGEHVGKTLPEPTEEWREAVEMARGTLLAQNPDLTE